MYDSKFILMYGISWAHICTGGILTMHTYLNCCLRAFLSVDIIDMDHTLLAIRFAFSASQFACTTAYTALHVYKKGHFLIVICFRHNGVFLIKINSYLSKETFYNPL